MSREYLREFSKKFVMAGMVYSDAWRKLIHEKNQKSKIAGVVDTGVVDTGGKFAAGIVDTGGKVAIGVNNTSGTVGKICTSVITTWRTAGLIQDFMEHAEPTPTFDTNITPIQNNKMQAASSFTFSPIQLYSTCNWRD